MLYTITTDANNYIMSVAHTDHDSVDIDLEKMDLEHLEAYRLVDGAVFLDEARKEALIIEENQRKHEEHIQVLKQFLKDTDYVIAETFEQVLALNNPVTFITDIIKILVQFKSKYAAILEERANAREEIEKG